MVRQNLVGYRTAWRGTLAGLAVGVVLAIGFALHPLNGPYTALQDRLFPAPPPAPHHPGRDRLQQREHLPDAQRSVLALLERVPRPGHQQPRQPQAERPHARHRLRPRDRAPLHQRAAQRAVRQRPDRSRPGLPPRAGKPACRQRRRPRPGDPERARAGRPGRAGLHRRQRAAAAVRRRRDQRGIGALPASSPIARWDCRTRPARCGPFPSGPPRPAPPTPPASRPSCRFCGGSRTTTRRSGSSPGRPRSAAASSP